ncbi:MAG: DUF4258 domain-containing protein, partial [Bdellovibrionales bacterium]|nr:DUF4258 domain-containing protein [Bdellovibrionales bacterium]
KYASQPFCIDNDNTLVAVWKTMKRVNPRKNKKLKEERGASFEDIVENGKLLDVRNNPRYPDQYLLIYAFENYAWVVVAGENPDRFITLYRSRKFKKEFGL